MDNNINEINKETKLFLPYSTGCFVCGHDNPHGLQIIFYAKGDKVSVDVNFQERFNGYKNVVHGGIISALLDEAMGWAAFIFSDAETFLFTRELEVTYKKNVPTNTDLLITTEFIEFERGIAKTKGKITDLSGRITYATSKGLFFPTPKDKMEETKDYLIFEDGRLYHPKAIKYCKKS